MNVRFYLDPENDLPHILRHGVTEEEVFELLLAPGEDQKGRNDTRIARGQAANGRYLKVIYSRDDIGVFVITAYQMSGNELKAYRRRQWRK